MINNRSHLLFTIVAPLLGIVMALIIVDQFLHVLVKTHNLHLLPRNLAESIYYNTRSVIQFEPACAEYDNELAYLLKKNSRFTFSNYEFPPTDYTINRMGTRDSDLALSSPETIFVGDSYTMGWGVNQAEAFPQQFATLTGKKTLNAGIASYGTAREMMLLRRLTTKETKQIVLQYCSNDFAENKQYVDEGYHLKIVTKAEYEKLSNKSRSYLGYYCKIVYFHIIENLKTILMAPEIKESRNKELAAHYFLKILAQNQGLLKHRKLYIIICPADQLLLDVIANKLPTINELQGLQIEFFDTSKLLQPSDEYPLDKHYRASGHNKIARLLADKMTTPK